METNNVSSGKGFKINPGGWVVILLILGGLGFLGYKAYMKTKDIEKKNVKKEISSSENADKKGLLAKNDATSVSIKGLPLVKIGVTAWVGYIGGQYANRGFKPNKFSRFSARGFNVEFVHNDVHTDLVSSLVNGGVQLIWCTIDALPSILDRNSDLAKARPVFLYQADFSRGGDVIVAIGTIKSVNDLRGKRVAFTPRTPSHSFLITTLAAAGMTMKDIIPVEKNDPFACNEDFKNGSVDAAVIWSPDDEDAVKKVRGAWRLATSKNAPYAIADGFLTTRAWVEENFDVAVALVEEWFIGVADIESNKASLKAEAVSILADGYQGFPAEFFDLTFENARRSTYGDNLNFFGLNPDYRGVTAEMLYTTMARKYVELGVVKDPLPWKSLVYTKVLEAVNLSPTGAHAAEGNITFTKSTSDLVNKAALTSKAVTISFPTGSAVLDENAKYIIDNSFVADAMKFGSMRIRIVGNTDNTGSAEVNKKLSLDRANAVRNYLVAQWGMDSNRFIVRGDGPQKAIADGVQGADSRYRVTNFELIQE